MALKTLELDSGFRLQRCHANYGRMGNEMESIVTKTLLRDFLAARERANRFIRDSSPPLTQKGLAQILSLEPSAFNKFINGTIFVNANGESLSISELRTTSPVFLRSKWTEKRIRRYIEKVQTECWRLGITHRPNAIIQSAARTETERLRLSKHFYYLCDIKDASNLGVASGLALWNVCAQEACDARKHLQPTMAVNALFALGDIVDRKENGQLCCLSLSSAQNDTLTLTVHSVNDLMRTVFQSTGDPCVESPETKHYECHHKAYGYGGYDKYFLGVATNSDELIESGIQDMFFAVSTNHLPLDGHVSNTATVVEFAIQQQQQHAAEWAQQFKLLIEQRLEKASDDPACNRLRQMSIPNLRSLWGETSFSRTIFGAVSFCTVLLLRQAVTLPISIVHFQSFFFLT